MQRRPVGRLGVVLACVALTVGLAPPAAAAPSEPRTNTDEVLRQLREELAESSEAMVAAAADLHRAEQSLPGARKAAAEAERLLAEARRREELAARRRGVAQTRLMLATQGAEQAATMVAEQRARIGRLARAVYQHGGPLTDVSMLLDASSPADFTERLVAFQTVVSSQRTALADLRAVETSYDRQEAGLEEVRDELARAHEKAQAELAAVAELEARAREARLQVELLVTARREALTDARAAQAEDERRMLELRGESTQLQALLAAQARAALGAAVRAGSSVPPRPGTLSWPVIGRLTSPFGIRVHPITGVRKLHTGADFGVACGTPIRAARGGTVIAAGYNRAYGWRTVVSHGVVGGVLLTTTYNHQQDLRVRTGQQVVVGEVIGAVGSTGYSTGCHLHFELLVNSDLVDPLPWLAAAR